MSRAVIGAVALAAALSGCGGSTQATHKIASHRPVIPPASRTKPAVHASPDPIALVTAESRNELLAVDLGDGSVRRRIALPADPENVAVGRAVVVVSPAAATVTILERDRLRVVARLHGFSAPHIPAIGPNGEYAYVTDDGAGTVTPIRLSDAREFRAVPVGAGAHHLSFSPNGRRLWIALGESARTIVILDTSDRAQPRVMRRFDPGFAVHDVKFSPDGTQVWVSAAGGPDVTVFDPRTLSVLFRVAVGRPPQHIAFDGSNAYVTSGYGRKLEQVDSASGRILARVRSPYGSFELDAADGYVATSSLLRGTLAIYDTDLRLHRVVGLAPATRDLAILGAVARPGK